MFSDFVVYATGTATDASGSPTAALIANFLPFIVLILFFWLIIIRPQKKREKHVLLCIQNQIFHFQC